MIEGINLEKKHTKIKLIQSKMTLSTTTQWWEPINISALYMEVYLFNLLTSETSLCNTRMQITQNK